MHAPVAIEKLSYRIGSRFILSNISFSVPDSGITVIVGENGAGKTTLLQILMGLAKPTSGQVFVGGLEPWKEGSQASTKVGYLAEKLAPPVDWSVREYLDFNSSFYGSDYSPELESQLMKNFRIDGSWRIGNLSAGQTRRVQAIGVLSSRPKILVIDEITAVLDIVGRSKFMAALKELCVTSGTTVLMATNILDDVDTYAKHVVVLNHGEICASGTKEQIAGRGTGRLSDAIAKLIEESESRE